MALTEVHLDDKYRLESGRVFLTGIQALVRLSMEQRRRDLAAGQNTAGYISGYRGSPLGAFDQQLLRASSYLDAHHVRFNPGVNEDLAATALWGTQQAHLDGEGSYDGVFGLWYAKGPGVDRSGDALRHSNLAGTAPLGGVLALLGDDHTCESSTTAHQSEFAMVDAMIPILNPAGVQEILDYGLYGIAMSRYAGCWVSLKCVHDTVESTASVVVDPGRVQPRLPLDHVLPEGGLNIRWPDTPLEQEARLHNHKMEAARAFCRANKLDRTVFASRGARVGIVTTGKSYLDVRQALVDLGIDEPAAERLGLRLYKVAMPWPLEPAGLMAFCDGLDVVIVVEEKRPLLETQVKDCLYGRARAPAVIGKHNSEGRLQFPSAGRLDTNQVAVAIGEQVLARHGDAALAARVAALRAFNEQVSNAAPAMQRLPYFCPGCPHNTSTRIPEGSRALAGIGCHYMALWMDRETARYTQMGAEGASWIGQAPFSTRKHMFQNIGDGTYFHSGLLPIRAAVAAGTDITFKILFNDAVAMTGGQPMDGPLTVPMITQQVHAEGVKRVVVVTDEPEKYGSDAGFAPGVTVYHRDRLDAVQRELRDIPETTVLVYDQTCAAEKRRRRKRGTYPDPDRRVFINEAVCEGCGDCGIASNCVAIVPRDTPLGRKRAIDQSACNKDYSCVEGFCPSFVSVHGGQLRRRVATATALDTGFDALPEPEFPPLDSTYSVVVTGVGGTGVITVGALLGMAAHLEGKGCAILDMLGLAQKGGAVMTHLRVAARSEDITAIRIAPGGADLLLGCDIVVAGGRDALVTARMGATNAIINTHEAMPGEFTRVSDLAFPAASLRHAITAAVGDERAAFVNASELATTLLGDSLGSNLLMLGFAYQRGLVPVGAQAIERAIELNGVAVEMNKQAFLWGRRTAVWPERAAQAAGVHGAGIVEVKSPETFEQLVARRRADLVAYQNAAYAERYASFVRRVRDVERERAKGRTGLAEAVARYYYKLLAYKDEYEVARLYTDTRFTEALENQFTGDYQLQFHLAPSWLARQDRDSGRPRKRRFGQWMLRAFKLLARLRGLRGTPFDPFGYGDDRRLERQLVRSYEGRIEELLGKLSAENHGLAVEIASIPEGIRGYGHVKRAHVEAARAKEAALLHALSTAHAPSEAA
ncbi:MAG: indolepyruvate ferredoxin oxidoreductase family protein [Gammaproteobacteria bacterium]|nr:indolepyruvate ferredoxin oxidoreductase family protein [Gammaproteobacteria bacterium]MDX2462766.1 indolepyruvate ferredoxin oxidoreductase family protein [Gammaproteobacteria bacterium]